MPTLTPPQARYLLDTEWVAVRADAELSDLIARLRLLDLDAAALALTTVLYGLRATMRGLDDQVALAAAIAEAHPAEPAPF